MNLKTFLTRICSRAGVIFKGRQCTKELIGRLWMRRTLAGRRMKGEGSVWNLGEWRNKIDNEE